MTYHIYSQIKNINDTECPFPNETLCHAPTAGENCKLAKQTCGEDDMTKYEFNSCYETADLPDKSIYKHDTNTTDYALILSANTNKSCEKDMNNFLQNNFIMQQPDPQAAGAAGAVGAVGTAAGTATGTDGAAGSGDEGAGQNDASGPPETQSSTSTSQSNSSILDTIKKFFKDGGGKDELSWIAHADELNVLENQMQEIIRLLKGDYDTKSIQSIQNKPDDSTTSPTPRTSRVDGSTLWECGDELCNSKFSSCNRNIHGKLACDEGFALISPEEKLNLKNKYKDYGHNSYEADRLMNNLEEYLLNIFK